MHGHFLSSGCSWGRTDCPSCRRSGCPHPSRPKAAQAGPWPEHPAHAARPSWQIGVPGRRSPACLQPCPRRPGWVGPWRCLQRPARECPRWRSPWWWTRCCRQTTPQAPQATGSGVVAVRCRTRLGPQVEHVHPARGPLRGAHFGPGALALAAACDDRVGLQGRHAGTVVCRAVAQLCGAFDHGGFLGMRSACHQGQCGPSQPGGQGVTVQPFHLATLHL